MKRKVLFCVPPNVGGAERVTLTIAKLLDREKYDIKIIIVGRTTGEIKEFVPNYMGIIHVKIRNIWDFTTFRLINLFKQEKPNTVFCSLMYLNTRVILAAKIVGGIKILIRNNNSLTSLRFDDKWLVKRLYPKADAIILQTNEMKEELCQSIQIDDKKVHVIFNPIDVDTINEQLKTSKSPFNAEYVNYVFVGRINYVKGLDVLIPAFAEVVKRNANSRLYIVGKVIESDLYFQSLQKLVIDLHIEEHVIWTDFTKNPYQYIKYANSLVLPSRVEGLPNVLLDAMYLQVPIVATQSVPVIERIVSKERGIVVDVNDVIALATAMQKVVELEIKTQYFPKDIDSIVNLFEN